MLEQLRAVGVVLVGAEDGGDAVRLQVRVVDDGAKVSHGRAAAVVDGIVQAEKTFPIFLC